MGQNISCCRVLERHLEKYERVQEEKRGKKEKLISFLPDSNKNLIKEKSLFLKELNLQDYYRKIQLKDGIFIGLCNSYNQPEGFGIKIKNKEFIYIGYFSMGQAHGQCFLMMEDGSLFTGSMILGRAETKIGFYQNIELEYRGGFKDNLFQGQGHLLGYNFEFKGMFLKGKKIKGVLKWKEQQKEFIFCGQFDQSEQFTGKGIKNDNIGTLTEPQGIYEGTFHSGKKEGTGVYTYRSGYRYEGDYKNNLKEGYGKIVSSHKTVFYCGQFKNGVPHGQGYGIDSMGNPYFLKWNQGLIQSQFD